MKKFFKTSKIVCRVTAKLFIISVMICFFLCLATPLQNPNFTDGDLKVIMLDVGQSEAVIFLQNNEIMVIDTGIASKSIVLKEALKELGVKKIDNLVITHPHIDHAGGMFYLLSNYHVENMYYKQVPLTKWNYTETAFLWTNAFFKNFANICYKGKLLKPIDKLKFADCKIENLSIDGEYRKMNNYSTVLKIKYKDFSILMTGDIDFEVENKLMEKDVSATVLKIAHHGSRTSNSKKFIEAVSPEFAICSSKNGEGNEFGHPSKRVVRCLEEKGIPLYRTDEQGSISIITDGKKVEVNLEPGDYRSGRELVQKK